MSRFQDLAIYSAAFILAITGALSPELIFAEEVPNTDRSTITHSFRDSPPVPRSKRYARNVRRADAWSYETLPSAQQFAQTPPARQFTPAPPAQQSTASPPARQYIPAQPQFVRSQLGMFGETVRIPVGDPNSRLNGYDGYGDYSFRNYGLGGYGLGGAGLARYGLGTYGQSTLGSGNYGGAWTFAGQSGYAESSSYDYGRESMVRYPGSW